MLNVSQLYALKSHGIFYKREIENALECVMQDRYVHGTYSKILNNVLGICNRSSENLGRSRDRLAPIESTKYKIAKCVWQVLTHRRLYDTARIAIPTRNWSASLL